MNLLFRGTPTIAMSVLDSVCNQLRSLRFRTPDETPMPGTCQRRMPSLLRPGDAAPEPGHVSAWLTRPLRRYLGPGFGSRHGGPSGSQCRGRPRTMSDRARARLLAAGHSLRTILRSIIRDWNAILSIASEGRKRRGIRARRIASTQGGHRPTQKLFPSRNLLFAGVSLNLGMLMPGAEPMYVGSHTVNVLP